MSRIKGTRELGRREAGAEEAGVGNCSLGAQGALELGGRKPVQRWGPEAARSLEYRDICLEIPLVLPSDLWCFSLAKPVVKGPRWGRSTG